MVTQVTLLASGITLKVAWMNVIIAKVHPLCNFKFTHSVISWRTFFVELRPDCVCCIRYLSGSRALFRMVLYGRFLLWDSSTVLLLLYSIVCRLNENSKMWTESSWFYPLLCLFYFDYFTEIFLKSSVLTPPQ